MATRLLALETSGLYGSLALADQGEIIAEQTLGPPQRTAQSLAPAIERLVRQVGWSMRDVQIIAVTSGPGSFTGLRVGVVTAKMLAYALGAEIVGVDTLEVLAARQPSDKPLWTVLDAQRHELFVAYWRVESGSLTRDGSRPTLLLIDEWRNGLRPGDRVTGPGLSRVVGQVPAEVEVVAREFWEPRAIEVARLAWRDYGRGRRDSLWTLSPEYFRRSAAEEKRSSAGT